jgi:hypothetical protein
VTLPLVLAVLRPEELETAAPIKKLPLVAKTSFMSVMLPNVRV